MTERDPQSFITSKLVLTTKVFIPPLLTIQGFNIALIVLLVTLKMHLKLPHHDRMIAI